jgi:hypothetical protein
MHLILCFQRSAERGDRKEVEMESCGNVKICVLLSWLRHTAAINSNQQQSTAIEGVKLNLDGFHQCQ